MIQDYPIIKNKLINFLKNEVEVSGTKGAVIGLSGGIDSALTAYLSVEALGSGNVLGLLLPENGIKSKQDINDAMEVVKRLGIDHKIIEINKALSSFSSTIPDFDRGNLLAS